METSAINKDFRTSPEYVTGFVEGEGTFTFSRHKNGLTPHFGIRLTAQDRLVLETIQEFFGGIGHIYVAKAYISRSGKTKTASYFRVARTMDLLKIMDHFDKYPLMGTKKYQFETWKKLVLLKLNFGKGVKY